MSNLSIILTKQNQNISNILRKNFEMGKYFDFFPFRKKLISKIKIKRGSLKANLVF